MPNSRLLWRDNASLHVKIFYVGCGAKHQHTLFYSDRLEKENKETETEGNASRENTGRERLKQWKEGDEATL